MLLLVASTVKLLMLLTETNKGQQEAVPAAGAHAAGIIGLLPTDTNVRGATAKMAQGGLCRHGSMGLSNPITC